MGMIRGESLQASIPAIGGGYVGLASVATILFVALIPFFAFRNVSRELGAERLNAMLFGSSVKPWMAANLMANEADCCDFRKLHQRTISPPRDPCP